jgi:6-phosphogluconolactonase
MRETPSRRDDPALTGAGPADSSAAQSTQPPQDSSRVYAYISAWTKLADGAGGGGGIHVFTVNMNDGSLRHVSSVADGLNAGYICISPNWRFLYATDERKNYGGKAGAGGGVSAFAIDPASGSLTLLNFQPSMGAFPAYICVDETGMRVVTANHGSSWDLLTRVVKNYAGFEIANVYDDSTVAMFPVEQNGALGRACDVAVLDRGYGYAAHAHSVNFDPGNRFVLACDKGTDHIYLYAVDPESRTLKAGSVCPAAAGVGPRHSAFHPRLPYVFIVNEHESSLSSFSFDLKTGEVRPIQTLPIVPADFTGRSMPADIRIHPNGKYVYGSNRGHDSIGILRIDEDSGRMSPVDIVSTLGSGPRAFNFDPTGQFIFAANTGSNDVVTFAVDPESGIMAPTGAKAEVPRPVCVKFAVL